MFYPGRTQINRFKSKVENFLQLPRRGVRVFQVRLDSDFKSSETWSDGGREEVTALRCPLTTKSLICAEDHCGSVCVTSYPLCWAQLMGESLHMLLYFTSECCSFSKHGLCWITLQDTTDMCFSHGAFQSVVVCLLEFHTGCSQGSRP